VERLLDGSHLLPRTNEHPNSGLRELWLTKPDALVQFWQLYLGWIRCVERVLPASWGLLARIDPSGELRSMRRTGVLRLLYVEQLRTPFGGFVHV
jgi:hypothetical protein